MASYRPCCIRIIRQVRIPGWAKKHVVRRHFPPKPKGRMSIFSNAYSPNFFFQIAVNMLRSGQMQGEIHGNCLRYRIMFNNIVGTSVNGNPSKCIRVVCTTRKCQDAICQRTLPKEIKTIYPIESESPQRY